MQEIITEIIVFLAVVWTGFRVYRWFRRRRKSPCGCGCGECKCGGCEGCALFSTCNKKEGSAPGSGR